MVCLGQFPWTEPVFHQAGNDTIVSVEAPRPLWFAEQAMTYRFAWTIDYEDPVYAPAETRDFSAPQWKREHPGQPGLLGPSGGKFTANLGAIDKLHPNEEMLLGKLVRQYNDAQNPGYFRLLHLHDQVWLISGWSRTQGRAIQPSIFDQSISVSNKPVDGNTALRNLATLCGQAGGIPIQIGFGPSPALEAVTLPGATVKMTCRERLMQILTSLRSRQSYSLLYDISSRTYYLSISPVGKIVTGADGMPTFAPDDKSAPQQ